jgi:pSer/pThr/pTyr-binding forkhead associated (FHA) protein
MEIPLAQDTRTFGPDDFAGLISPESVNTISRQHFFIKYDVEKYFIDDYSSTNGTRLNGVDIRGQGWQELKNGDRIEIAGVVTVTFQMAAISPENFYPRPGKSLDISVITVAGGKAQKQSAAPLLVGIMDEFILCDEGVYIRRQRSSWFDRKVICYQLYPWDSLSLYGIDEKNQIIGLKSTQKRFKLKAASEDLSRENKYEGMKAIIFSRLPEKGRTPSERISGYRWGYLALVLCVLIAAYFAATFAFKHFSSGVPGDGKSDLFGAQFSQFEIGFIVTDEEGNTIHEYGDYEVMVYPIIHPASFTNLIINAIYQNGGISRLWRQLNGNGVDFVLYLFFAICGWLIWAGLLFSAYRLARSAWQKTPVFKQ